MAKEKINFSTYPQDYFTGAQARIYFGAIWVDDIATIQYQTSHSKTPLYGYADHQFRAVAKGQFMVRGSFTVAFKQTGYLYSIMELARADKVGLQLVTQSRSSFKTYIDYISKGLTVEQALDFTSNTKTSNIIDGGNFKSTDDFNDMVTVLNNSIWGGQETIGYKMPRSDELDYYKYTGGNGNPQDIDIEGFDILLTFGNYKAGNDSVEHTVLAINNVHITGESLLVSPSAEPIGLTYDFFAYGINDRISSSWDSQISKKEQVVQDTLRETTNVNDETLKAAILSAFDPIKTQTEKVVK